jgi:hypothetical protein
MAAVSGRDRDRLCVAELPSLRSPARTGEEGVTVQPDGALRLAKTRSASPGPSLCSVVVTGLDAPAARLSGVDGSMPSATAAGSGELIALAPRTVISAPPCSGKPLTGTITVPSAGS